MVEKDQISRTTKVEHALGVRNFLKTETGGPGRYTCYLWYVSNDRSKIILEIWKFWLLILNDQIKEQWSQNVKLAS